MKVVLSLGFVISVFMCAQTLQVRAQRPELVVQTGHSALVLSVALSPDGRLLATGSYDNTIKLWEVATGRELLTLSGHHSSVNSIAFSKDGQMLASGGHRLIMLWDVATGRELRTLSGSPYEVTSVAFSVDGKTLASGSANATISLWDVATGSELRMIRGHRLSVKAVAFSPDGAMLASGSSDFTAKLWEVATGGEVRTLRGHYSDVNSVAFSTDGQTLASGGDKTIKLWEVATGREVRSLNEHSSEVNSVAFNPEGTALASGASDETIRLWEVSTGREVRTLRGHRHHVNAVTFSANGQTLASSSLDQTIKLWEVATGRELRTFRGHSYEVGSLAFSANGQTLAIGRGQGIVLWEVATGRAVRTLHSGSVNAIAFSPDGALLAGGRSDETIGIWEVATGRAVNTLSRHSSRINSVAFSTDGRTLASGSSDNAIKLWDVATGRELRTLRGSGSNSVAFSADGQILVGGGGGSSIKVWELATGRELLTLSTYSSSVGLSLDGKTIGSGSAYNIITLWDVTTGRELRTLRGHSGSVNAIAFSADGQTVATGSKDNTIKLWEVSTGRELRTLAGHSSWVSSVVFSADGSLLLSGSRDATTKLWRVSTGELVASLVVIDRSDWAVVTPEGKFDASPGAQSVMHFVVGLEPITLEQLKERYYEPGLLPKLLGFNKEPLRDVSKFENPKLYPDFKYEPPSKRNLTVTLINRGGGIGRVQVFINGKEFLADARDDKLKRNPNVPRATLTIDLSRATSAVPGKENEVRVVAWNVENYISSRGSETIWELEGDATTAAPEVYAIVGGISKYAGEHLNLNFAAKDAVDMANAIELGAKRLFGANKVHLTLLSTTDDPRSIAPSKENFTKAFAAVRARAKPMDILIVYLAGHGITLQRGSDTYCYLTQEARTTDTAVLADSAVRQQTTITSEELVEWIKQIPALKQVLMLDTCAAGAAQAQLKLVDKRDASGDAIRAIDRAKDRTGSYILMGSAADAVSYEASQFGQGLLTYALLKGMKGAALRNDEFIDVSKLFQFAREEVEQLARNVGGIQKPIFFAPKDESFEVGQLKSEDRLKITLAVPRPMILRPRFFDEKADDDTLNLMKTVRARLRDESFVTVRGPSQLVFVDDEEFPGGYDQRADIQLAVTR